MKNGIAIAALIFALAALCIALFIGPSSGDLKKLEKTVSDEAASQVATAETKSQRTDSTLLSYINQRPVFNEVTNMAQNEIAKLGFGLDKREMEGNPRMLLPYRIISRDTTWEDEAKTEVSSTDSTWEYISLIEFVRGVKPTLSAKQEVKAPATVTTKPLTDRKIVAAEKGKVEKKEIVPPAAKKKGKSFFGR